MEGLAQDMDSEVPAQSMEEKLDVGDMKDLHSHCKSQIIMA